MKSISGTWNHIASATLFNELLASVKRSEFFGGENESVANWPQTLSLPNPFNTRRWPQIGTLGLGSYGFITNDTKKNYETFYILDDNVTKIHGKHQFLFGAHIRRDLENIL